ncbi:exodeoxyribonuclease VII small subunit [Entomomonas asaccharolytica]|uniref:Exodeoxyribonuclease 7 small subunit n=1 Tax=Entomomonas asaccharolytica TaxID=2785331 RepID=A0A974RX53_9GAMM|nr:exodeoxyribonuclease VII small subunit [Entomomonas asaccharolytica]QQP84484.1 exodeoxyribonuclease VII small subunit [Entomomonas asaccharolytica]
MAKKKSGNSFEVSLVELQALVERMESGKLTLEESLADFEKGIGLTRECQSALTDAEQKVQMLLEKSDKVETIPFDVESQS